MANEDHLTLLKGSADLWNIWRDCNPAVNPDLREADLSGLDLFGVNLGSVDLSGSNLSKTNLFGSSLRYASLHCAGLQEANLQEANLRETDLAGANFYKANLQGAYLARADLSDANLQKANLQEADFRESILCNADFTQAFLVKTNLNEADLRWANFTCADLSHADLSITNVIGTNFTRAILTGACLEGWNLQNNTILSDVECDYVYLKCRTQERQPVKGSFGPQEFTRRFQIFQNILELTFRDGVPWKAFAYAFNESNIQVLDEYGDELFLQEYKVLGGGLVTLKVCYPPNANGDKIKDFLEQRTYKLELEVATLKGEVKAQGSDFEKLVRVLEVPKIQVDHITTLNVQIGETNSMSGDNIYTGGGNYIKSNHGTYIEGDQNIYASDQRQSLTEVIAAIQQLLDYLEQPSQTSISAQQVAEQAAARHPALRDPQIVELAVKNTPTLQMRLRSALTAMGIETVKVIFAPAGIPIEGIKAWLEPE